ncbi:MAG: chemotaxis protein CheA [Clostridia bacterium]|jgi:two-component system chemotaxis sensor kinase CheA|nr:chemotaxis protein CheA [Clostridia bacterium]
MNMEQYQDLFIEESEEHLQALNQNLLALESDPDRLELLDSIFRAAHTLKGMSATMGYDAIAKLTHEMENLLDQLREREVFLSKEIINSLFKAADLLENMLLAIRGGQEIPIDAAEVAATLFRFDQTAIYEPAGGVVLSGEGVQIYQGGDILQEFNEYELNLFRRAAEEGAAVWKTVVRVEDSCVMKAVRAFMVFKNLETLGEIIKSVPSVQDIEDEKFQSEFTVYLVTAKSDEDIRAKMSVISEISLAELTRIILDEDNSAGTQALAETTENTAGDKQAASPDVRKQPSPASQEKKQKIHQTVRVDINRLDKLMSLVGELVINKTRLEQINVDNKLNSLNETIEQINRITDDLQTVVQNVRMVAIEQVFNRFPRMVRDLANELGKEVNLLLEGKETELDRTVIDEISDPLVHLIRNSLDHGLELPEERLALKKNPVGLLKLQAKQEGNRVVIIVEDDGRGIDFEAIKKKAIENNVISQHEADTLEEQQILNLIFEPGFSTAEKVTDLSGRGVGLDVVKSKILSLNGQVYVETRKGQGTKFIIKLPLTLAIIQALMVKVQQELYAIPLANIDETTSLELSQVKDVQGQQVVVLRGKVLPLYFLRSILAVPGNRTPEELYVVVVRKGDTQIGVVVDELVGQQETVINSLGKTLSGIPGIAGATILGDGSVSLIIDIGTLF